MLAAQEIDSSGYHGIFIDLYIEFEWRNLNHILGRAKSLRLVGVLVGVSGIEPDTGVQELHLDLCSGILLSGLVDHTGCQGLNPVGHMQGKLYPLCYCSRLH